MRRRALFGLAVAALFRPVKAAPTPYLWGPEIPYLKGAPRADGIQKVWVSGKLMWSRDMTRPYGDWA